MWGQERVEVTAMGTWRGRGLEQGAVGSGRQAVGQGGKKGCENKAEPRRGGSPCALPRAGVYSWQGWCRSLQPWAFCAVIEALWL